MGLSQRVRGLWQRFFPPKSLGQLGEDAAARFLRRKGYGILARGDRLRHRDELDIVALDGATIVFVEVKTRRTADLGHPSEAVDEAKQRRLTRLAVTYLKRHRLLERPARFDVVAITWPERGQPRIEHIENAFEAVGVRAFYS